MNAGPISQAPSLYPELPYEARRGALSLTFRIASDLVHGSFRDSLHSLRSYLGSSWELSPEAGEPGEGEERL